MGLPHLAPAMQLRAGQASRAGRKPHNEDSIGIRIPSDELLVTKGAALVIADGVSAAEAGKAAAETCVTGFLSDFYSTPETWSVKTAAERVLGALNRWLYAQSANTPDSHYSHVCTFTALILKSRSVHLFHVGDTRVYRLRGGRLEQLTSDHIRHLAGGQTYLARAMGVEPRIAVDYQQYELEPNDAYLLTSDGVHGVLPLRELEQAALSDGDCDAVCEQLLDAAYAAGSDDNLSCQLVRVEQLASAETFEDLNALFSLPFPPPLSPGMVLDGYRIERELAASSRSQVYLVTRVADGTRLVMKTPSPNFNDDPAYVERFVTEEWIGSRIQSPQVIRCVPHQGRRSALYYLSEYVEGETLAEWRAHQAGQPDIRQVVDLIEQIAKGLRALHRKEVLHQDLKPDNVLVLADGSIKLIDFGSAYVRGIQEIESRIPRDHILGTADYAAPEYRLMTPPGQRSDQFSLAVIAYELLTGKLPFDGKLADCQHPHDFAKLHYVPAYDHNPLVPVWLDRALARALSVQGEARYDALSEFLYDLRHPNVRYLDESRRPLIERRPVTFWKGLALAMTVAWLVTLGLLVMR